MGKKLSGILGYDVDEYSKSALERAKKFLDDLGVEYTIKRFTDVNSGDGLRFSFGDGAAIFGLDCIQFYAANYTG